MTRGAMVFAAALALAGCERIAPLVVSAPVAAPVDHVALGERLLKQNRPELALASFNRALAAGGGPEALTGAGIALLKLGRRDEALRLLEAALARAPDMPSARNALGVAYYEEGNYAAALQEFRRADELTGGGDPSIALNIGVAQMALAQDDAPLDGAGYDVI